MSLVQELHAEASGDRRADDATAHGVNLDRQVATAQLDHMRDFLASPS